MTALAGPLRLVAWLDRPDLAAERAQLLRLAASGRHAVLLTAAVRLAGRGLAPPPGWEEQARCTLAAAASDATALRRFRRVCFAEAAQLLGPPRRDYAHETGPTPPGRLGVRRYGPPPRLQGCSGKTIRWRPAPAK